MQASRSSWDFPLLSKANLPPRFAESLVKASSPPKLAKNLAKASSPQKLAKSLVVLTSELPLWCLCLLLFGRQRHQARSIPVKWNWVSTCCWHVDIHRFSWDLPWKSHHLCKLVELYDENGSAALNDIPEGSKMKPCSGHHSPKSAAGCRPACHSHHCFAFVFVSGSWVTHPSQVSWIRNKVVLRGVGVIKLYCSCK